MASQITDTPIVTAPVNVAFQRRFLERAKPYALYLAGSMPGIVGTHQGSFTASWRRYNNLAPSTSKLTELNGNVAAPTRDSVVPTTTNIQATLGKYGQHFVINEEADLLNFNGQTAELLDVLAISAGRSINQVARNELEDNATLILGSSAASDTAIDTALVRNDIRNAVNTIEKNDALPFTPITTGSGNFNTTPIMPAFYGLVHPDVREDIEDMSRFVSVSEYSSQTPTELGEFGSLDRVRFMVSTESSVETETGVTTAAAANGVRTSGNDAADVYNTVIYGRSAFGTMGLDTEHVKSTYTSGDNLPAIQIIQHARGSSGALDPFNELSTMAYKSWFVTKILNGDWIRTIRTAASSL